MFGGGADIFIVWDMREESVSGDLLIAGMTFDVSPDTEGDGEVLPDVKFRALAWIARLDRDGHLKWRKGWEGAPFAMMRQFGGRGRSQRQPRVLFACLSCCRGVCLLQADSRGGQILRQWGVSHRFEDAFRT